MRSQEYRLINIPYDLSFFANYVLGYHNTETVVTEFKNDFLCSYPRDIFIGIKKNQKSSIISSLEYLHPTFFDISVNSCHFSVDLSLDFIFILASIINKVCTLKQFGLQWQEAQKHINTIAHALKTSHQLAGRREINRVARPFKR